MDVYVWIALFYLFILKCLYQAVARVFLDDLLRIAESVVTKE